MNELSIENKHNSYRDAIKSAISFIPITPSEIMKIVGASAPTVYRWLRELVISGEIVRLAGGQYQLPISEDGTENTTLQTTTVEVFEEETPAELQEEIEESVIQTFIYKSMGSIRMVLVNGQPWFVLKDICNLLMIENHKNVTSRLENDEKGVCSMDTLGGKQILTIINESGLYAVILRSNKPEARAFRKWVTSEVLPSIRKTGSYSIPNPNLEPEPQKPLTQLEMLALSVKVAQEQEKRINNIETRLNQIIESREKALGQLSLLPPAKVKAAPKTTRAMIRELVANYCQATGIAYEDAHRILHKQFYYRYGINLVSRYQSGKYGSKLDIVEELGMLEQYYAICTEIFVIAGKNTNDQS